MSNMRRREKLSKFEYMYTNKTTPSKERKCDDFLLDNCMKKIEIFLLHFNQSKRGIESTVRVLIKDQIFFQLWYTLYFIKFLRTAAHYVETDLYEFNREWLKRLAIYAMRDPLTINLLMRPVCHRLKFNEVILTRCTCISTY